MGNLLHPKQTKVLSKKTAVWPAVLADAQLRLREVFGMELVELRSAGQGDPTLRVRALRGNKYAKKQRVLIRNSLFFVIGNSRHERDPGAGKGQETSQRCG
jgi:hypothetical protein